MKISLVWFFLLFAWVMFTAGTYLNGSIGGAVIVAAICAVVLAGIAGCNNQ